MQESKYSSLFLFIFSFCKHHVVRKDLGTYIQLDMSGHELLLLTSPLRWMRWEAKLEAPIFLCVRLKPFAHVCTVSVSSHRRLNDGWVCGLAKRLRYETLPEKMMNCGCKVDWEYSLLVFNRVYAFLLRCCDELLLFHEKFMIKFLCLSLLIL